MKRVLIFDSRIQVGSANFQVPYQRYREAVKSQSPGLFQPWDYCHYQPETGCAGGLNRVAVEFPLHPVTQGSRGGNPGLWDLTASRFPYARVLHIKLSLRVINLRAKSKIKNLIHQSFDPLVGNFCLYLDRNC
jgi:hypothetical protein